MKVLLLSESDIDGGAARAAYRLHKGLQATGITSQMLVRAKFSNDNSVITQKSAITKIGPTLNSLPLNLYPKRTNSMFSVQWFIDSLASKADQLNPDLVNLHWICNGFLKIETIAKLNKPVLWTLHDMWAFTGGCHYTQGCNRYIQSCGTCPQIQSQHNNDLSSWIWRRKQKAWQRLNLTIVSPSVWLAKCAKESSLFRNIRIDVIPNGIDINKYKPLNKNFAREVLNLPQEKLLILFGAGGGISDPRKGFHYLQEALQHLSQTAWKDKIELVVFGSEQSQSQSESGFKYNFLGKLSDDITLALVYSAADVFVAPSIQDNLSNTVMEAIACGLPCTAFNIGGMPDLIEHQQNGYLAVPYKTEDLAQGMIWILENRERHQKLRDRARQKAEVEFSQEIQARNYLSLFNEIKK